MARMVISFILFAASSAAACDRCVHHTEVAHFSDPGALSSGACGYGSMALGFNRGHLAAGNAALYKNGAGCGACFQVRCGERHLCSPGGTSVFLSDLNQSNQTGFVLSRNAFVAMAVQGKGRELLRRGIVAVEYKRVPCNHGGKSLSIRVEESSRRGRYLGITVVYQGGQTEVVGVDIAPAGSANWVSMERSHGAVWGTKSVPVGAVQVRLVVTAGYDGKSVWLKRALPAGWKAGSVYETGMQIRDIAQEGCSPCADRGWQ